MNIPSWAAEIQGTEVDLEYLVESQTRESVRVEKREGRFYLLGRRFDGLPDYKSAHNALTDAALTLSGLLVVLRYAKVALTIKEVVGMNLDGSVCQRFYTQPVSIAISVDTGSTIYTSGDAP